MATTNKTSKRQFTHVCADCRKTTRAAGERMYLIEGKVYILRQRVYCDHCAAVIQESDKAVQ